MTSKSFENVLVSYLFVGLICIATISGVWGCLASTGNFSQQEKRTLAPLPRLASNYGNLAKIAAEFESFYNDRYPFRLPLNSARNYILYKAFHTSGQSSCSFGHKDWIFYATEMLPATQQNHNQFEGSQQRRWLATYQSRRDILASHNIRYVMVIAPEKGTIYPELMPAGWKRDSGISRLEGLQSSLLAANINFVNCAGLLAESKRVGERLYFSNDSHWNSYGAFQISQELFSRIEKYFPAVKPFPQSAFSFVGATHTGDLAIALGLQNVLLDKSSPGINLNNGFQARQKISNLSASEEVHEFVVPDKLPRAYLLHDSFMAYLLPYLAEKFSSSEYHATHSFSPVAVFSKHPDILVDEIAERHLYDREPESVPLFVANANNLTPDSELSNFKVDTTLLLKSVSTRIEKDGLCTQICWQTVTDQKLDCVSRLSCENDGWSIEHRHDLYHRFVPAGTTFVESIISPLPKLGEKGHLKISVIKSFEHRSMRFKDYEFSLQSSKQAQLSLDSNPTSYSATGEVFE